MVGSIADYAIRSLLALAGIGNIALATATDVTDGKGILIKLLVLMTGIITLLLSVFFTGFMIHLANHSKDRRILFADINKRLDEIKNAVCPKSHTSSSEHESAREDTEGR